MDNKAKIFFSGVVFTMGLLFVQISHAGRDIQKYGEYTVIIKKASGNSSVKCSSFEIVKGHETVFNYGDKNCIGTFTIGHDDDTAGIVSIGNDITGDGKPNLLIWEWSGGANCCSYYHLFDLSDKFKFITTLNGEISESLLFEDVDDDGILEFVKNERVYIDFNNKTFVGAHEVILGYKNGQYLLRKDLMCKGPISKDALKRLAKESLDEDTELSVELLLHNALNLVYTCNADALDEFIDLAWQKKMAGKPEFQKKFYEKFKGSIYMKALY